MGIGLSGTTAVYCKKISDGRFESRCGISLFGSSNMTDEEMLACDHDPFHPDWYDNIVRGFGNTEAEANKDLEKNYSELYEAIWE